MYIYIIIPIRTIIHIYKIKYKYIIILIETSIQNNKLFPYLFMCINIIT